MNYPKVTVMIDSYNYEKFLPDTIDSILNQTYPQDKIEIIVIDDGSTDNTQDVVRLFGDRVKYLYKPNGGQASAFNVGLEHITGEIVFLLDADDLFHPDKIAEVCSIYEKHKCKAVFNALMWFGENVEPHIDPSRIYNLNFMEKLTDEVYKMRYTDLSTSYHFLAETSGQSFARDTFAKMMPCPAAAIGGQTDIYLQTFALLEGDIHYTPRPLTMYRKHSSSAQAEVASGNSRRIERQIKAIEFIAELLRININSDRADLLARAVDNRACLLRFMLENHRGNKLEAFKYILRYRTSPKNPLSKIKTKLRYIWCIIKSRDLLPTQN